MSTTSRWSALDQFLTTDTRDAGCAETLELLDVWVDTVLVDLDPAERQPRLAAHLAVCGPCADDLAGLLALAGEQRP